MINEVKKYSMAIDSALTLSEEKKAYYKNIVNRLHNNGFPIVLNSYHLSNLCGIKWDVLKNLIEDNSYDYHKFYITKKDKVSKREILVPSKELSFIQKYIKENILDKVEISGYSYGFAKNKNIKKNAEIHLNSNVVLNIDLKDFFPSIDSRRVYYIFYKICGYDKTMSYCLTKLVMYKNKLPQGACTSPIISNIVSYKLDLRLGNLAAANNMKYTRYADDITFSGEKITKKFYLLVKQIITEEGFKVNDKKVHLSSKAYKQEVTGLIINNNKVSVDRKYIRKIKQELYYIKKYGLDNHIEKSGIKNSFYVEHLKGKILFIKSIDEEKGIELLKEFNDLKL